MKAFLLLLVLLSRCYGQYVPPVSTVVATYANISTSACTSGQSAVTTDSIYTAVCLNSAWSWYWQGVPVHPPPSIGWTLESQSGSSITANADGTVTLYFARRGTISLDAAYRSGSATQTVSALMCSDFGNIISGSTDTPGEGVSDALGLRDASGKYASFFATVSGSSTAPGFFTTVDYWTNVTSYSSTPTVYPSTYPAAAPTLSKFVLKDCHWFREVEDSTSATWSYNVTGSSNNWVQFFQASKTAFLASGAHSPAVVGYDNANGQRITLVSWLQQ
jgi:hypothetical protein